MEPVVYNNSTFTIAQVDLIYFFYILTYISGWYQCCLRRSRKCTATGVHRGRERTIKKL